MKAGHTGVCFLEIEFTLRSGKRREFNRLFEDLHGHEGEGHVRTTVYEDREEPGHMIWVANWSSMDCLKEYMRGEGFGVLLGAIRTLSTLTECRVVDGVRTAGAVVSMPERTLKERGFQLVDGQQGLD